MLFYVNFCLFISNTMIPYSVESGQNYEFNLKYRSFLEIILKS